MVANGSACQSMGMMMTCYAVIRIRSIHDEEDLL